MPRIIVHPHIRVVTKPDIIDRESDLTVFQPPADEIVETATATDEPVAFIAANHAWRERYLDGLSAGDWVSTAGSGYDQFPVSEFEERDITFTNTTGIHYPQISEQVFGLLFTISRQLDTLRDAQERREWVQWDLPLTDFGGDNCCIVGLGEIGEPLAERAAAFDMTVRGVKRSVADYDGVADQVYPSDELAAACAGARVVIVCVPLTEETRGYVAQEAFAACADDAVVVNVARGPVVDTADLLTALDEDEVRAAALDVFDEEPLPEDSPLWERDDVYITPHCSGLTDKYADRFLDIFFERYERWEESREIPDRIV